MKKVVILWMLLLGLLLAGCAQSTGKNTPELEEVSQEMQPVKQQVSLSSNSLLADSFDTAVVLEINEKIHSIRFWNLAKGRTYALSYDSATGIKDRFENELVVSQLKSGDVVKVAFEKENHYAHGIWIDPSVDVIEDVTKFVIHNTAMTMEIGEKRYSLDPCVNVYGDGQQLSLMDISSADTLTVYAMDHSILSIAISTGHGYVRLEGDELFEGGFVEFGQSHIFKVEPDMLFVLPVGSYDMLISNKGMSAEKPVEVLSGKETAVDVSDLVQMEGNQEGTIVFTIDPSDAILLIDGQETDYSKEVKLSVGIHQMKLKKEGYKTISQFIKVGATTANLDIEMEKTQAGQEDDASEDQTSVSNNTITANSGTYQVYIDAPIGAELYLDGKYIGVIPTSFEKKAGNYTVSLRRSGYITRSYSLEVDNSQKDMHYTFSALQEDMTQTILDYTTGLGL